MSQVQRNKGAQTPEDVSWRWMIFELLRKFGNRLIVAFVALYFIHTAGKTLQAFAGRSSFASLLIDVASHLNLTVTISVSLTGAATALWLTELGRNRKTRERLSQRILKLEKRIDPGRSSSKLTSLGTTRTGDE